MKKIILTLISIALCSSPVLAGDNNGTATAAFLRLEQGARALGMGGAFVAMHSDVESIWWNPAGAAGLPGTQLNLSYTGYIADISGSYAGIAMPIGESKRGTVLANVHYISLGSIEGRDATGAFTKNLNLTDTVISAGYAFIPGPRFFVGILAKNIQQNLGEDTGSGFAADAGFIMEVSPALSLGLSLQNLGPKLKTAGVENKLPQNMRLGCAYAVSPRITLAVDGEQPSDADSRIHAGTEFRMSDSFSVRAGYNTSSAGGFAAGVGILTPISFGTETDTTNWWETALGNTDWDHRVVRIDYAYVACGDLDATHRLSLTIKF